MHGIIRWYSQKRKTIWKVIGAIAALIVVIQLLQWVNSFAQNKKQQNIAITGNNDQSNLNTVTLNEDKSTVTGQSLSQTQTNSLEVIDQFVEYCNNNQINEAYNLLSEECKSEMYPTVSEFKKNYYNNTFSGKTKNASVENWVGDIYKVKFTENALSTGIYNAEEAIQDYITIIEDDEDNIKLNINGYIGKEKINQSKEAFEVKIEAVERHQYMDYEVYEFEVTNDSRSTIILNDIENTDAMYLEDRNNIKYYAYMHELSAADMKVLPGETKKVAIKYYSKYSSTKKITSIIFSEIALGGNEYASFEIQI